jgi:mannose-6-phosphate isomerase-like protein (cupin superfamily)/DNA-binding XRE family transcriptional regulator
MSLRELARRLHVSASLVSQIEIGRVQPSVRTLYAIVSELGLSLDEIFELVGSAEMRVPASPPRPGSAPAGIRSSGALVRRSDHGVAIGCEPGVRWEQMAAWEDPGVEFMIAVYRPGGGSTVEGDATRDHGREFGLVLSGMLRVTVDRKDHLLGPGDSITFSSSVPHRLHNEGEIEARAFWVTVGRHGPERDRT